MQVVLSGGNAGGTEVEWPDGAETVTEAGHVYRRLAEDPNQAVFVGEAQ